MRGFREQRKLFLAELSDAKRAWLDAQHEGGGGRQQQQQQKQRDRGPSEAAERLALGEFAIRAAPAASRTEHQSDQTSDTDQTVQQQQEEVLGLVDIGANLHGRYRYVETQRVTSSLLTGGCVLVHSRDSRRQRKHASNSSIYLDTLGTAIIGELSSSRIALGACSSVAITRQLQRAACAGVETVI